MTSLRILSLAAVGALLSLPAAAAEFTILLYETPADIALRTDTSTKGQQYWGAYAAYGKALQDAGIARGGAPLEPSQTAKVVTIKNNQPVVTDGAYGRTQLVLGGYFKIDAPDMAAAVSWAARAPAAQRGGVAEVRPQPPMPPM